MGHQDSRHLLLLLPDPLQVLPKAFGSGWHAQEVPAQQGGDTPELESSANGKYRPGNQVPERVARHAAYFLTPSWGVVPCCPFI